MASLADFFADVDALGIVERHVAALLKLEEEQGQRLISKYREVRRQLQDRLLAARPDSFTAQQLRGTLLQIEWALGALRNGMFDSMSTSAYQAAELGVSDLVSEVMAFEEHFRGAVVPINVNAAAIATDANNLLINKYEASLEAYNEALRAQIASSLADSVVMQRSYPEVVQSIGRFFLGEEWKIHRIARTELHNVYGVGKLTTMRQLADGQVPDLKKTLYHPMDDRTAKDSKYVDRLNLVVPVDEPFRYKWAGQWREYMAPPDRPNDRSILIPFRDSWV